MRNVISLTSQDDNSARALVAAEVRGQLAKRKIPTYKLSEYLDSEESRGYWQRRVSGELAMDIDDLEKFAVLFGMSLAELMPTMKPRPVPPQVGPAGIEPTTSTVDSVSFAADWMATITPIRRASKIA